MKKTSAYIKEHLIMGLVVIVPIAVILVILMDSIKKLMTLTAPLTANMELGGALVRTIVALALLVLTLGAFFLLAGIILNTYWGKSFKGWLENKILKHVPFFNTLKGVSRQVAGVDKGNYPVVEVALYNSSNRLLGLQTDILPDGRSVVYIPFAPIANIGQVHIVSKENIQVLDMSLKDAMELVTHIGFGANKAYKQSISAIDE